MKRIKSGIRKDFDTIPHKTKEEMLAKAGVTAESKHKARHLPNLKLIPAIAACIIILALGATLALAIEGSVIGTQIKDILGIKEESEQSVAEEPTPVIHQSYSPTTRIMFSDDVNGNSGFLASVDDIADIIGQDFYYPPLFDSCDAVTVLYNTRYYGYKTQIEYYNLQFTRTYSGDMQFWVDFNNLPVDTMPDDIVYESRGTTFLIRKNTWDKNGNMYYAKGRLEDVTYSFTADSIENAKAIIDSFKKTNE